MLPDEACTTAAAQAIAVAMAALLFDAPDGAVACLVLRSSSVHTVGLYDVDEQQRERVEGRGSAAAFLQCRCCRAVVAPGRGE